MNPPEVTPADREPRRLRSARVGAVVGVLLALSACSAGPSGSPSPSSLAPAPVVTPPLTDPSEPIPDDLAPTPSAPSRAPAAAPAPPPLPAAGSGVGAVAATGTGSITAGGKPAASTPFRLTASIVRPLAAPGSAGVLRITVTNPGSRTLEVTSVDVQPGRPSARGCLTEWLTVGRFRSGSGQRLVVAAGRSASIDLRIGLVNLPDVNQDACKGARFPLSLSGSARETS